MTRPTVPGVLDLAALSAASARLTWRPTPHGEATAEGYQIATTGDNPAYHTAYKPGGRIPTNELGSGGGEFGLAKCKHLCERHLERSRHEEAQPENETQVAPPLSNNLAQPSSNN